MSRNFLVTSSSLLLLNKLFDGMTFLSPLLLVLLSVLTVFGEVDIQGLIDWASSNGAVFHPDVSIVYIGAGFGRGYVANKDLQAKDHIDLISFPLTMGLSTVEVEHSEVSDVLLACDVAELTGTNLFAFHFGFLRRFFMLGNDLPDVWGKFWAPYIKSIPDLGEIASPVAYGSQDLDRLQGSLLFQMVEGRKTKARSSYNAMHRSLRLNSCKRTDTRMSKERFDLYKQMLKEVNLDDFLWGLAVVWSRNFATSTKTPQGEWVKMNGLMPLADMFNAAVVSKRANTVCMTDQIQERFVCKLVRDVSAGDQLLVDYSSAKLTNFRLMLDYGFVVDDNPYKEVYVELPQATQSGKTWLTMIGFQPTVSNPQGDRLSIGPKNWLALKKYFIIYTADDTSIPEANRDEVSVQHVFGQGKTFSPAHEIETFRATLNFLQSTLTAYPSTLDEDIEELQTISGAESHRFSILQFLISEKQTLKQVFSEIQEALDTLVQDLRKRVERGEDIETFTEKIPKLRPKDVKVVKLDLDELRQKGSVDIGVGKDEL